MTKTYFNMWKTFNSSTQIVKDLSMFISSNPDSIKNYIVYVSKGDKLYVDRFNQAINKAMLERSNKKKIKCHPIMRGFQVEFVKNNASRKRKPGDEDGIFPGTIYRVKEAKTLKRTKNRHIGLEVDGKLVKLTDNEISNIKCSFASSTVTSQVHDISFVMGLHLLVDTCYMKQVMKTTKRFIVVIDYRPSPVILL